MLIYTCISLQLFFLIKYIFTKSSKFTDELIYIHVLYFILCNYDDIYLFTKVENKDIVIITQNL